MARKPAQDKFDALQAIRDGAFVLFGRFGYEGVSVGDIAAAAKLSKGALYWHYQGKEALYLECLGRLHAIFDEHILDPMRSDPQAVSRLLKLFQGLGAMLADPRLESGVAGYWLITPGPETERFIKAQRAFETRAVKLIEDTLRLGVQQGRFDFGDDLEVMARAIIAVLEAVILPLRHQSRDEQHRILGVMARTLFRAYAGNSDLLQLTRRI